MSSSTPNRIITLSAAVLAVSLLLLSGNGAVAQSCDSGCGDQGTVYDDSCSSGASWPNHCGMAAPTYPVPYEVPVLVGRTEFTYPPVMPHHSLPHYRKTYSYRHGPGMARTTVKWRPSWCDTWKRVRKAFELPR